jgi:hypothetical protein
VDLIVVGTVPGREMWLRDCLATIERDVVVVSQRNWELDKIRWCAENLRCDRFLFLSDTVLVKRQDFFDASFAAGPGSVAISDCPTKYGMFMGVFLPDLVARTDMPTVTDKEHSIELEVSWAKQYASLDPEAPLLFADFTDGTAQRTEVRHGRVNLRLENDYLVRHKGTWR